MAAINPFYKKSTELVSPARNAFAVTPDDVNELPFVCRWLFIGGDGDLTVILEKDTASVTLLGLKAGTLLHICVRQVLTTTSATDLVALY